MHGVIHFDLPARDPLRLADFYHDVFGWEAQANGDYILVGPPDGPDAGIGGGLDPHGTAAVIYIEVENIDAVLAKVETLGGEIVLLRTKVPGGDFGYEARFRDAEGTLVGLWSRA